MPLDLSTLSAEQKDAVTAPLGPVLVLAGAGSGKTRVLTHRAAHLVSDVGAFPREIVALTFTNKAAREMRQRIKELVPGETPFFGTFHAWALLMLRRHGARLGLPQPFAVLAGSEQGEALRRAAKAAGIVIEAGKTGPILREISRQKSGMAPEWSPSLQNVDVDKLAAAYQKECRRLGAIDFDDMLLLLRDLLSGDAEVREKLRTRTPHVLVDEFQDTNRLQYEILRLLRPPGESQGSLFAVGDDDQSIYAFRGATIGNILAFERDYPGTRVFHLAANYRSSAEDPWTLRDARRARQQGTQRKRLVAHRGRRRDRGGGGRPRGRQRRSALGRAEGSSRARTRDRPAMLYRTNGQSRLFEESLTALGIGEYRIHGGAALLRAAGGQGRPRLPVGGSDAPRRDRVHARHRHPAARRGRRDGLTSRTSPRARGRADRCARSSRRTPSFRPARARLGAFADVLDAIRAAGPARAR
ncbi:MAG: ATP-dependent helicase [Acidobacteriota bacterium]